MILEQQSQIPAFLPLIFTLGSWSHNICPLPFTSCHLCTCKVCSCYVKQLRRWIYKKIHYMTLRSQKNVAHYPPHHVTYSAMHLCRFKADMSKGLWEYAFIRRYIIWPWPWGQEETKYVTQYPLYHVIHALAKFEDTTSNSLGGDAFILYLTLTLGSMSHKLLASTFHIMWLMKMWSL